MVATMLIALAAWLVAGVVVALVVGPVLRERVAELGTVGEHADRLVRPGSPRRHVRRAA